METTATDQVKFGRYNLSKYASLALYSWLLAKIDQNSRKLFHR